MNWNKKFLINLNWYIPIAALLLVIIGLMAISSAIGVNKGDPYSLLVLKKQLISIFLGIILIIAIQFFDYSIFDHYADIIYFSSIGVLVLILFIGTTSRGGKSWLNLGAANFQPSELAKIALIMVLASVLADKEKKLYFLTGFVKPFIYVGIPFALIILQNDLGTSLVLLAILIGMLYVAGGNLKFMLIIFGGGFSLIVLMVTAHLMLDTPLYFLKEYQLDRLIAFINPGFDPHGIGYNLIQSKIALGSGQLLGKGWFAGTQNQLEFLPEKHTDFIFSVIGEEFGFLGVLAVIVIYLLLLWQILNVARNARDNYGMLVATGVGTMFFFHALENIGMTMGLMPITGLPLPLVSYGGSSMVTSLMAIGLVININLRRKKLVF